MMEGDGRRSKLAWTRSKTNTGQRGEGGHRSEDRAVRRHELKDKRQKAEER